MSLVVVVVVVISKQATNRDCVARRAHYDDDYDDDNGIFYQFKFARSRPSLFVCLRATTRKLVRQTDRPNRPGRQTNRQEGSKEETMALIPAWFAVLLAK